MPAGHGAGATQINGGPEVIDLKVCMSLLKKTIVFFPLLIMVVIFLIKAYLTTDVKTQQLVRFFNPMPNFFLKPALLIFQISNMLF